MITFNIVRWLAGRQFPSGFIGKAETRRWEKRFVASVALSGLLWGVAVLFYVPDQPEYGLFLALLIVGMSAAATASLSYHRIAYPVFVFAHNHPHYAASHVGRHTACKRCRLRYPILLHIAVPAVAGNLPDGA